MTVEAKPLANRSALVTGAASGIGRAIAARLAAAGARVAVTSREPQRLDETIAEIAAVGSAGLPVPLDLRDTASAEEAVDSVVKQFGALDIVVANSGIGGPTAPLWEVSVEEWDDTFAVNVRGTFIVLKAAIRHMIAGERRGSIVVIGSMTGKRPLLNRSPYAASKLALVGMVRTVAAEAGPFGIRVNLISPGFVSGQRLDWVVSGQAKSRNLSEDAIRDELIKLAPLRQFVNAESVADAAVFLASDAAAAITGSDLNVTAGAVMY